MTSTSYFDPRRCADNGQIGRACDRCGAVWSISAVAVIILCALWLGNQVTLLRAAIPICGFAVAISLYLCRPVIYLQFTLWTWLLVPLVRRIVDWRFGFVDPSVILLTPFLVSLCAIVTPLRRPRRIELSTAGPFLLCLAAVTYGLVVALIRAAFNVRGAAAISEICLSFMNWFTPIVLGMHVHICWRRHELYRHALERVLIWSSLVLGAYGIFQFAAAPAWDCYWLQSLPFGLDVTTFGQPAPFQIRVWSTLNAPAPFALFMVAGLIFTLASGERFRVLFAAPAFVALLLSMVRLAWLGGVLAVLLLALKLPWPALRRLLFGLALLPVCLAPVVFSPQMIQTIKDRAASLIDPHHDESLQDRTAMYENLPGALAGEPAGLGLSYSNRLNGYAIDSGVVSLLMMLGFTGTALFLVGVASILLRSLRHLATTPNPERTTVHCIIVVGFLLESLGGNIFINVTGVLFWLLLGLLSSEVSSNKNLSSGPLLACASSPLITNGAKFDLTHQHTSRELDLTNGPRFANGARRTPSARACNQLERMGSLQSAAAQFHDAGLLLSAAPC